MADVYKRTYNNTTQIEFYLFSVYIVVVLCIYKGHFFAVNVKPLVHIRVYRIYLHVY